MVGVYYEYDSGAKPANTQLLIAVCDFAGLKHCTRVLKRGPLRATLAATEDAAWPWSTNPAHACMTTRDLQLKHGQVSFVSATRPGDC